MYLAELKIKNFRQFDGNGIVIPFNPGVTALVGENDSGKTAIVDAIRYALLTRDTDFIRVLPADFHIASDSTQQREIHIRCKLVDLTNEEKGAFVEYLTYEDGGAVLYVNWAATRLADNLSARRWVDVSVCSGAAAEGPAIESLARQLLAAAYLRPLRDAEREMSPGRQSRLSQILQSYQSIDDGAAFDVAAIPATAADVRGLSLVGLADYLRHLIDSHGAVQGAQTAINEKYLSKLALSGDKLHGRISFSDSGTESSRLRAILERLELELLDGATANSRGEFGLGSNNLLFMACEMLLLGREADGLPLLLIEEPEAHLHPQRQLRLMEFLELAAKGQEDRRRVQVIVTTHSPNLSSKISLKNLVLLNAKKAYSLSEGKTKLSKSDYRFLERFLDTSKANLFFAKGVVIVEGDAESILVPAVAKLLDKDLTEYGVSIVNVGGVGLKRYSKILQQADGTTIDIPVARLADMDVMPDCAPEILGLVSGDADPKWRSPRRRWYATRDLGGNEVTRQRVKAEWVSSLQEGDDARVKTFVADHWTLEYDLCMSGLAADVTVSAYLAKNDEAINAERKSIADVKIEGERRYEEIVAETAGDKERLCSQIYDEFHSGRASKAVAAQYLVEHLQQRFHEGDLDATALTAALPPYIVAALTFVTQPPPIPTEEAIVEPLAPGGGGA